MVFLNVLTLTGVFPKALFLVTWNAADVRTGADSPQEEAVGSHFNMQHLHKYFTVGTTALAQYWAVYLHHAGPESTPADRRRTMWLLLGFKTGKWRGDKVFVCSLAALPSLDSLMLEFVEQSSHLKGQKTAAAVQIYRRGRGDERRNKSDSRFMSTAAKMENF